MLLAYKKNCNKATALEWSTEKILGNQICFTWSKVEKNVLEKPQSQKNSLPMSPRGRANEYDREYTCYEPKQSNQLLVPKEVITIPDPEVIKLCSCSTQLCMNSVLLINHRLLTIANSLLLNMAEHESFPANKYENANYRCHFHIY